jgi:flagellar hook assembly protein FlgD
MVAVRNGEMVNVYSADGRSVVALRAADDGWLRWNGTDRAGSRVPPGVYTIRAGTGQTRKVIVR